MTLTLPDATARVQALAAGGGPEHDGRAEALHAAAARSQAGEPAARAEAVRLIADLLAAERIAVSGPGGEQIPLAAAAEQIWRYLWGLDTLQDLYDDPEVEEIQVNRPDSVWVIRRGRCERAGVRLRDDYHIEKLIWRLTQHDRDRISRSNPQMEAVRLDGARVTATLPPFSEHPTLVLRKHHTFRVTPEALAAAGTASPKLVRMCQLLVRGRASMLISGATGTGKTTLMRWLVGQYDPALRIVCLETDAELRLAAAYPDRNIVELQECLRADPPLTLERAFRTALRQSPHVILVGEMRSGGEAEEAVKACLRGHDGSMATVHTSGVREAVDRVARMILETGKRLPVQYLRQEVARAYRVVVHLEADEARGVRKLVHLAECFPEGEDVGFRDLAVWRPASPEDWFGAGDWDYPARPSATLLGQLRKRGVRAEELREVGWGD